MKGTPLHFFRLSLLIPSFLRCAPIFPRLPYSNISNQIEFRHCSSYGVRLLVGCTTPLVLSTNDWGCFGRGKTVHPPSTGYASLQNDADSHNGWSVLVASARGPSLRVHVWTPASGKVQLKYIAIICYF